MTRPAMRPEYQILTFDLGTTAVKTSLFSPELAPLCCITEEYSLDTSPGGRVELNPEVWLRAIRSGLAKAQTAAPGEVAAVGVTTQGETLIPVNEAGEPLGPAVVWLDARAEAQAVRLSSRLNSADFHRHTGLPEINGALPLAKLLWFREEQPELYRRAHRFLLAEDYILHWLTGRFVTEKSLQCSTGWFDLGTDGYWAEALDAAGIDKSKLPEALPCGVAVGALLPERAAELSLSPRCVAVTGAMDQTAAALGAGCTERGVIAETTGTALVMAACTASPDFDAQPSLTIYRHAIDGSYLYLPMGSTGGMTLKWFRDQLGEPGLDYAEMDCLAAGVPPGSGGLITLPHLAGCVNPDNEPAARAVFFGVSLSTTRAHFIRSILESVGFLLREFIEMLRPLGVTANVIHSIGGGSKSALWEQIKADCCGVPFVALQQGEAASLGAAMLAAKGIGRLSGGLSSPGGTLYSPQPASRAACENAYRQFCALYRAVKPLYSNLQSERSGQE